MKKFIIVKYADQNYIDISWPKNHQFTQEDSAQQTYTAQEIGSPREAFYSKEEAQPWLEKMIELNPTVGYAIKEISDEPPH